jgi:hypothetical protein
VVLAGLLVAIIVAIAGVLVVLLHSSSKDVATRRHARSPALGAVTTTMADPVSTTKAPVTVPATPNLTAAFPGSVEIGHPLQITIKDRNGHGLDSANVVVDGSPVAVQRLATANGWTLQWNAPGLDGPHMVEVRFTSAGVQQSKRHLVNVTLPQPVAVALARAQDYVDALAQHSEAAIEPITDARPNIAGFADLNEGRVFYVSSSSPSTGVYDVLTAYVVHQTSPDPADTGQRYTAFFCETFRVDENRAGPNLTPLPGTRVIDQRPMAGKTDGNLAPNGWLSFQSYKQTRRTECGQL